MIQNYILVHVLPANRILHNAGLTHRPRHSLKHWPRQFRMRNAEGLGAPYSFFRSFLFAKDWISAQPGILHVPDCTTDCLTLNVVVGCLLGYWASNALIGLMCRQCFSSWSPSLDSWFLPNHSWCWRDMSHDMTKPTKWVFAQRRLRSAWVSAQSVRVFAVRSIGS